MNRKQAIAAGYSTYVSKKTCTIHGHRIRYVSSGNCVDCNHENTFQWKKRNPHVQRGANRRYHLRKKYGIDKERYHDMLIEQEGKCALCHVEFTGEDIVVDHCHKTGVVRGLIHRKCNVGLGHFDDDIELLEKAIDYLRR